MHQNENGTEDLQQPISLWEAFCTWIRVASLSFGGPAGQISVMHRIIVQEKKWITEERFLHALNYCMLLPGPEAQQLATYIGWLMHRTLGGLMAGILFILPGAVSILALSIIYAIYGQVTIVQAIFFGLKPAIIAIVLQAVIRLGKRVLKNPVMVTLAVLAFISIFFFDLPFPLIIIAGATIGIVGQRVLPEKFRAIDGHGNSSTNGTDSSVKIPAVPAAGPSLKTALFVILLASVAWFSPLVAIAYFLGTDSVFLQEGVFFSKAAVVTFGGAYSVLSYIAQQAVENHGWLKPGEMMDGLGMAETTPGPLIMVVQFVGFMAAYRNPGELDPIVAGMLGSLITTWVTFVPCFLWIFLGAPYIEKLRHNRAIGAALSSITAMVVGVVLNLAIWFSLHTLFASVDARQYGFVRVILPDLGSLDIGASIIAVLSIVITFWWKRDLLITLCTAIALGVAWKILR